MKGAPEFKSGQLWTLVFRGGPRDGLCKEEVLWSTSKNPNWLLLEIWNKDENPGWVYFCGEQNDKKRLLTMFARPGSESASLKLLGE